MMVGLDLQATPAVVWRDATGAVPMHAGATDAALPEVFGPRWACRLHEHVPIGASA